MPLLWVVGRRLRAQETAHDKEVLLTRGMGRLTGEAMRGSEPATAKLIELLDDEGVIRCQSARALVMVDKPESNEQLFRKVSYWPGDQKSAMVDVLRRMKDPRARGLMEVLANDRSRLVAGRARRPRGDLRQDHRHDRHDRPAQARGSGDREARRCQEEEVARSGSADGHSEA